MLLAIVNVLLSPFCLLIFLFGSFGKENQFFTRVSTNTHRLNFTPYVIYCIVYVATLFVGATILDILIPTDITFEQVFQPTNYTISIIGWCATALTLFTYSKGMEGNIMGFIFFPLLALSSMALIAVNIFGFCTFFWQLDLPAVEVNGVVAFLLHAFSPLYIFLLIQTNETNKNEAVEITKDSVPLLALIMQLLFFGINWAITILFAQQALTFHAFFGAGQPFLYYLPLMIGLFYWLVFLIHEKIRPQSPIVLYLLSLLMWGGILIEILYYAKLLWSCF